MNNINRHPAGLMHELADTKAAREERIKKFSSPHDGHTKDELQHRRSERQIIRGNRAIAGLAALAVVGGLAASHFLPSGGESDPLTPAEATASKQIDENRASNARTEQAREQQELDQR